MIIKTCTPLAATETINFLWKYSTIFPQKKSILKMNFLHYGGKVARKALT